MAFFTVSTSEEQVRDFSGSSNYLNKSGMYEVIIKDLIVDVTQNNSQHINMFLEYNGQEQIIFQAMRLTNNDGSPNVVGCALFNKLNVICGAGDGAEVSDPVEKTLPIGKGGEMKECYVLEQFSDTPIILRLQMEYSLYDGKIQERKAIRNFFRVTDKATASEIVNNSDTKGAQYAKEEEIAEVTTYKDGLTEEAVQNWIKGGRNNNVTPNKPTSFSKRTFGKK